MLVIECHDMRVVYSFKSFKMKVKFGGVLQLIFAQAVLVAILSCLVKVFTSKVLKRKII